jgi:hypothetical protein
MTPDLDMGLQRSFSSIELTPLNELFLGLLQARLSRFCFGGNEESPDSTEQCTGEEPGLPPTAGEQTVPQKITAACLAFGWDRQ